MTSPTASDWAEERARELACVGGCIPRYARLGHHNAACDRRTDRITAALREAEARGLERGGWSHADCYPATEYDLAFSRGLEVGVKAMVEQMESGTYVRSRSINQMAKRALRHTAPKEGK